MEGSKDKATGKVREIKGRLTGNRAEEARGIGEQAKGEVKGQVGRAKRKISGKADELKGRAKQKTA